MPTSTAWSEPGSSDWPFGAERLDQLLLEEGPLGARSLEVRERWQGLCPVAPGNPFMAYQPLAG